MGLFVAGGLSSSILLNLLGPLLVGPLGCRMLFRGVRAFGSYAVRRRLPGHRAGAAATSPSRSAPGSSRPARPRCSGWPGLYRAKSSVGVVTALSCCGQAARWYWLMTPPRTRRRRMGASIAMTRSGSWSGGAD